MRFRPVTATLLACSLVGAACTTPPTTSPEVVGELRAGTGILKGYLPSADLPDSLALVAPPPAEAVDAIEAARRTRSYSPC